MARRRKQEMSPEDVEALLKGIGLLMAIGVATLLVWGLVVLVTAVVKWCIAHPFTTGLVFGATAVAALWWAVERWRREHASNLLPAAVSAPVAVVSFATPSAVERAADVVSTPPARPAGWTPMDQSRVARSTREEVLKALQKYEPLHAYAQELGYHAELAGWLRARFPELQVEIQRGRSRPDIVIGDIALEVKGPTDVRELQTIADKCSRYSQHFSDLIFVLFDVRVSKKMYEEWHAGIQRTYPRVGIVRLRSANPEAVGTDIFCARCGKADRVPFEPKPGTAVVCRACFKASRAARVSSTGS